MLVDDLHRSLGQARPVLWGARRPPGHHPLEAEGEERRGVGDGSRQRIGIALGQLARIDADGQPGHRHLHLVLLLPGVEPLRRSLTGGVGVEGQHDPAGVSLEQAHMVLGERRAARGDGPLDADTVEPDHVGVALTHDDLVGGGDVSLGPVEPVQGLRLGIDRRLRRVLVLRRVLRAGQDPPAEGDGLTRVAEDREQHPRPERILHPVAAVAEGEPDGLEELGTDPRLPRQCVPVVGCPPQPELSGDVTGKSSRSQVVASGAGARVVEQPPVVPLDGLAHRLDQPFALGPLAGSDRSMYRSGRCRPSPPRARRPRRSRGARAPGRT